MSCLCSGVTRFTGAATRQPDPAAVHARPEIFRRIANGLDSRETRAGSPAECDREHTWRSRVRRSLQRTCRVGFVLVLTDVPTVEREITFEFVYIDCSDVSTRTVNISTEVMISNFPNEMIFEKLISFMLHRTSTEILEHRCHFRDYHVNRKY